MPLVYRTVELERQRAWDVLHSLQSDLEYFLQETDSRHLDLPKHALDMMLKRVVCELERAKVKVSDMQQKVDDLQNKKSRG